MSRCRKRTATGVASTIRSPGYWSSPVTWPVVTRRCPLLSTISGRPGISVMRSPWSAGARRRCGTDARDGSAVDGDEPGQVHRVPHLLGDLQTSMDQPARRRIRVVQQRGNPPGTGVSAHLRESGAMGGRLGPGQARTAAAAGRWAYQEARHDLLEPENAVHRRLLRALDL